MASHGAAVVSAFESASFMAPWAFLDSMLYASVASGRGEAAIANSGLFFCSARVFARLDSLVKEGRTLSTSTETQIRRSVVWALSWPCKSWWWQNHWASVL